MHIAINWLAIVPSNATFWLLEKVIKPSRVTSYVNNIVYENADTAPSEEVLFNTDSEEWVLITYASLS